MLRKRFFTSIFVLSVFTFPVKSAYAQIPTEQDCLGAIPICGPVYVTPSSTFGTGSYPNEDPPSTCLIPGEYNSQWFIFTVITSGNLAFTTTPVNVNADYDWALYNLTNATCADIPLNSALSVSCNSSMWGVTGISSTGIGNYNGPGFTNAFNYLYPVTAGETYVLNMNNWSGSTGGYTLDFSASSATIFDSVKPKIDTVSNVVCTDNTITFSFSEKIECSSVSTADFLLTGPWGPYTLSGVTGATCTLGGTQEITFTATVTPQILHGGIYTLHLTDAAGSVQDLCGNIADTTSKTFYVDGVQAQIDSFIQPFCAGYNGAIFSSGTLGGLPYSYTINNGASQLTGNFLGLDDTTYLITITDAGGCFDTVQTTLYPATGAVKAQIAQFTDAKCYNSCDGTVLALGVGGVTPYSYSWSTGAVSQGIAGLCIGTYSVIVTDVEQCKDTIDVTINQPVPLVFSLDSVRDASCFGYKDGYVAVSVSGGTPNYFYSWSPYGSNGAISTNMGANNYTVEVIDNHGCHYDTTFTIYEPAELKIIYPGDTVICAGTSAKLNVPVIGGTPPYNYIWSTGASLNPYYISPQNDSSVSIIVTDAHNCIAKPANYLVQVLHAPIFNLGNDTLICEGDVVYKSIFIPGMRYEWQDGSKYYDVSMKTGGKYYVTVYNDCFSASDTINIEVDDCKTCVHMPDAFTPNGDGLNDEFAPIIGCDFTAYILKVFNRWGQMVYFSNDPTIGWDGKFNGKPSELGTYIWQLEYAGSQHALVLDQQLKGYVVLVR
ncbi:MAG: gliding motility-associated C-terminal domain-containing protein [Chitinophagales bacterium]|nr:gliding motility-associated C-terminal domain-containing protein [Chitinophagales bacterium]